MPIRRQQRTTGVEFGQQEGLLVLFIPLAVVAQSQITGQLGNRLAVTLAILTDVELEQGDAEAAQLAQHVEQQAVGDDAHAALLQRVVAELQRLTQLLGATDEVAALGVLALQTGGQVLQGFTDVVAQDAQHGPIRLVAVAGQGANFVTAIHHRQLGDQLLHVGQEQAQRHPTGGQQHFAGHLGGDERVAVAVTPHPGGETDRRHIQRQTDAEILLQTLVELTHEVRDGRPHVVFDHGEAPLGFVDRGRTLFADFVGVPGLIDQLFDAVQQEVAFALGQVAQLQLFQTLVELNVLVDQGATSDFRRVSGQHQLDIQFADGLQDLLLVGLAGLELGKQVIQGVGAQMFLVVPGDGVELLGHVGQVQKLTECPSYRQQLFVAQTVQDIDQCLSCLFISLARGFGQLPDGFDLCQKLITQMILDGLA